MKILLQGRVIFSDPRWQPDGFWYVVVAAKQDTVNKCNHSISVYIYVYIYTVILYISGDSLWPLYPLGRGHQQPLTRSGFHHLILYRYTNLTMSTNQVTLQTSLQMVCQTASALWSIQSHSKGLQLATKWYWETPCNASNFKRKSSHTQPFRQGPLNRTEYLVDTVTYQGFM